MAGSRLYLPRLASPPSTILEYLSARFPHVPAAVWLERMTRGVINTDEGASLGPDALYRHGLTILYPREVSNEPAVVETETILYQDSEILVADKPHGMPVTPAGDYVARTLLSRLEQRTGLEEIAPAHRLDRETAGLVLFVIKKTSRARYQELFQTRAIERDYLAVATISETPLERRWIVENRLAAGTPWFRSQIVDGPINAVTEIEILETRGGFGLFHLKPQTGRKHQLRVHMASIGYPILGDPFYPELRSAENTDPPLQLLAAGLSFADPVAGDRHQFRSARTLRFGDS